MIYFCRPLKKRLIRPERIATFDIETYDIIKATDFGFYDGEDYEHFDDCVSMLDRMITRKYDKYKFFAHYGAKFDFNFVLDCISKIASDRGWKLIFYGNGGLSMIKLTDKYGNVFKFLDSYKILPHKLMKLTHSFDVEHKKMDVDVSDIRKIERSKLLEYLRYDTIGLYEVLRAYESRVMGMGVGFKATQASQSIAIMRSFLKCGIPCLSKEKENFVRESYHGGRVEIYKKYCDKPIKCFDFNSLYPYVMQKYDMPVGGGVWTKKFHDDKIGFYQAQLKVSDLYIPVLPYVADKKLLFPIGQFEGIYNSEELKLASEMGYEIEINKGLVFEAAELFKDYISKMYALKLSSDPVQSSLGKSTMNSSYGKMAQRRNNKILFFPSIGDDYRDMRPFDYDRGIYEKDSYSNATFILPHIAAHITACARVELYRMFKQIGFDNIFYCDTDSVFTTKNVDISSELGGMKLEYSGEEAIFQAPKMYAIRCVDKDVLKVKGFPTDYIKTKTFDDFRPCLKGDCSGFVYNQQRIATFKQSIIQNNLLLSTINMSRSIKSGYDKRTVLPNFDTRPLEVRM